MNLKARAPSAIPTYSKVRLVSRAQREEQKVKFMFPLNHHWWKEKQYKLNKLKREQLIQLVLHTVK